METTVVLSRKMGDYAVTQRTKDGYFDGNELLRQWNAGNDKKKTVEDFLSLNFSPVCTGALKSYVW